MSLLARHEFFEKLRIEADQEIRQYEAKNLLVEAGLDETLAYHLSQRIIRGTERVVKNEAKKQLDNALHWIERA